MLRGYIGVGMAWMGMGIEDEGKNNKIKLNKRGTSLKAFLSVCHELMCDQDASDEWMHQGVLKRRGETWQINSTLAKSWRSTSTGESHVDGVHPCSDVMKCSLLFWGLPPQNLQSQSYHEKIERYIPILDILQNTRPAFIKTVKIIKHKKSLRHCLNQEESEETRWPKATRDPGGWVPGTKEGHQKKTEKEIEETMDIS